MLLPRAKGRKLAAPGGARRRVYTLQRGHYAVQVHDEVINHGSKPWQGYVFRKLSRVPTIVSRGMTPDSFSFITPMTARGM
ncbi:YidC/Oxa1 family insertase periplasmic domain-containing protein [Pantoea ananatis]|uniref:YidC/Oxa1 family insertase periplasmic domain-containing protein n=1 Tax=Pantoea ananas TaxID=553 RepID=UPI00222031B9|nr:YidC/Oxa1 family insertase periplasmic domain-containing protein [Pantoea ananatis]